MLDDVTFTFLPMNNNGFSGKHKQLDIIDKSVKIENEHLGQILRLPALAGVTSVELLTYTDADEEDV